MIDGRRTNDDLKPEAWLRALEGGDGSVAIYFELAADHEWWLAYDPDGEYDDEFDGPYLQWSTYPFGPWDLSALPRGILEHHLENIYGEAGPDMDCQVYRSRVVRLEDARRFVQHEISSDS